MKLNGNQITIALVATALLTFCASANADEQSKDPQGMSSAKSVTDTVAASTTRFARGFTGPAFTPNRPISPKAPQVVSTTSVSIPTPVVATTAPRGYTAHSPISPAAPAFVSVSPVNSMTLASNH